MIKAWRSHTIHHNVLQAILLLLTFVSYCQAQMQNWTLIIGLSTIGGFILLSFLLAIVTLACSRSRRQTAVNGYENNPLCGNTSGSHPIQQIPVPTTFYSPERAQTAPGNPPSVQHGDSEDYFHPQGFPPPPAYDPDVEGGYFAQSSASIEGRMAGDFPYNPPPFPPTAHLNGQ